MMEAQMGPRKDESAAVPVGRYMGVGLTLAASTLVFTLAGEWIGERLGSRSLGVLIGAFVGAAAGFYWMIRTLSGGDGGRAGSSDGGAKRP
jgi:hypothetical protein